MYGFHTCLPLNETNYIILLVHSLWSYQIFETDENRNTFLRIVEMAKTLFQVPIALISLVEKEQQWFLAESGLGCNSTGRDVSFCGHAILNMHGEVLEVLDATKDWRFQKNPLVLGPPHIRFYAGAPLRVKLTNEDQQDDLYVNVGTICLIDSKPHHEFPLELQTKLKKFSKLIVSLMENWKRERVMFMENTLQMTILKGLQSTLLSKSLQQSISIFLDTMFETLNVSALLMTQKSFQEKAAFYCGKGIKTWEEPWAEGNISFETIKEGKTLVHEKNRKLLPSTLLEKFGGATAASTIVRNQDQNFGVLIILSTEEKKPITENYLQILHSISRTISTLIGKYIQLETIERQKSLEQKTKEEIRGVNERLYVTKKILSAVSDEIKDPLQGINDSLSITNTCSSECQSTNKTIANCTRAIFSVVNNLIEAKYLLSPGKSNVFITGIHRIM
jgi:GAF domain-containing protein